jgi:8-oxo-dGTP diphosphatase
MAQEFLVAASVAVFRRGRLLLLRRGPGAGSWVGYWEMPGGAVERGETLARAARREALEEAGIRVTLGTPFHFSEWTARGRRFVQVLFLARARGRARPADDMDALRWVLPADLGRLRMTADERGAARAAFARRKSSASR